jgi:hypothetical protein
MDQSKLQASADEDDDASSTVTVRSTKRPLEKPTIHGPSGRSKKDKTAIEMKMLQSLVDVVMQPEKDVGICNGDEDAIFGQFVVSEMRKITDCNAKLFLKQTITNALFQARIGPVLPYQHYGTGTGAFSQHFPPQYPLPHNFPEQHNNAPTTWSQGHQWQPHDQTTWAPASAQSTWHYGQQLQSYDQNSCTSERSKTADLNSQARSEERQSEPTYDTSKSDSSMLRLLDGPDNC